MAYSPPSVSATGLTIPSYYEILVWLVGQYQAIYGQAVYLGNDSADFQDIAVRALMASNTNQALAATMLSFNPQTATGTSLDLLGRLIGTAREAASYSTAVITLSGIPGTVITGGVLRDINGNLWTLASPVTVGSSGTVMAIATCQKAGNITANPGDISIIATPTAGWTAAINTAAAQPGSAVEADSKYRARLLISQAKPSLTLLAGTAAAIAAIAGVTRSVVFENFGNYSAGYGVVNTSGTAVTIVTGYPIDSTDTGKDIFINGTSYSIDSVTDGSHLVLTSSAGTQTAVPYYLGAQGTLGPPHSITCVVEGGAPADIAQAIYDNRGIGCLTNGSTSVTVTDPKNKGYVMVVSYDELSYLPVYVSVSVHPLSGFTTATQSAIQAAIVSYLNSLGIGQGVVYSELYGAALDARPDPDHPLFSIRAVSSGALTAETSGDTTNGSPTVTVTSGSGIVNGQAVVGVGIPDGTTVSSVVGTTVTLSQNATANGTGVALSFFTLASADIPVSYNYAAQGSTSEVIVNLV